MLFDFELCWNIGCSVSIINYWSEFQSKSTSKSFMVAKLHVFLQAIIVFECLWHCKIRRILRKKLISLIKTLFSLNFSFWKSSGTTGWKNPIKPRNRWKKIKLKFRKPFLILILILILRKLWNLNIVSSVDFSFFHSNLFKFGQWICSNSTKNPNDNDNKNDSEW